MNKKIIYAILFVFLTLKGFSQISYNEVHEGTVEDWKTSAITVHHSSGILVHFQASLNNIYVKRYSAYDCSGDSIGNRLNYDWGGFLSGGFEDPDSNIVIYGKINDSTSSCGFVMKINPINLNIINVKLFRNYDQIIDGCWGLKNVGDSTEAFVYSFLINNGNFIVSDHNFNFNSKLYGIEEGKVTDISWNQYTSKFMGTGIIRNDACFLSYECNDSYFYGVQFINLYGFIGDYYKTATGLVVHTLQNDGRILIAESGKDTLNNSFLYLSIHTVMMTPPYYYTVERYLKYGLGRNDFDNKSMILNPVDSNNTLNSRWYDFVYNDKREYLFDISVFGNNIDLSPRYLDDDQICINNLINNPGDQLGSINIATGILKDTIEYSGGLFFIHNDFFTKCYTENRIKMYELDPQFFPVYERVDSLIDSTYIPRLNFERIVLFTHRPDCSSYHYGVTSTKSDKNLMIPEKPEYNIINFENEEFMTVGFKGDVNCQIFDLTGKLIYSIVCQNETNNRFPNLPFGIYLLRAKDSYGNVKTIKFLK